MWKSLDRTVISPFLLKVVVKACRTPRENAIIPSMQLVKQAMGTEFFRGIPADEVENLLYRLNGVRKTFKKGETIVHAGFKADRMMVVVSGRLRVYEETSEARPVLVREIGAGEVLGLWILHVPSVACWPGTVIAAVPCTLISLDIAAARRVLASSDVRTAQLAINISRILANELFSFWRKLMVMDGGTIESRVEIYLSELDNEAGHVGQVTVPFDRERMAEYFGVSRPALSRALGHMRDRGLITWHKNVFQIKF